MAVYNVFPHYRPMKNIRAHYYMTTYMNEIYYYLEIGSRS